MLKILPSETHSKVDENDLNDMMAAADSNNDGTIDFAEFVQMMKSTQ